MNIQSSCSMSRIGLLLALLISLGSVIAQAAAPTRPNIVMCFADDWGRYASIYAGLEKRPSPNQVVQTPNIDRVAREGVLFTHAFVNSPSCTPCRSSFLSGQYFFRTGLGAILIGAQWDSGIPSFPLLLNDAGYHIGETSKVWSPGTPNDAPFGAGKYAYEKRGGRYNNLSENVTAMVANGLGVEQAKQQLYDEVRGNFDDFIAARPAGKPFCYWFGPTLVHRAWVKGSGKALWGIDPDSLQGKLPPILPDVPEVREDFADYLGEIQGFDAGVGVLLKRLAELGELDNTIIVVSGDHGAPGFPRGKCNLYDFGTNVSLMVRGPLIKPGRVVDDFTTLMDLAPTFLELAGAPIPSVMTGRSLVNVLRSEQNGLVDPRRTAAVTGRERHVGDARAGNLPYPHRALRTEQYLYIRNFRPERYPMGDPINIDETNAPSHAQLASNTRVTLSDMDSGPTKAWLVEHRHDPQWKRFYEDAFGKRPSEELYDLRKDPHQMHNVASDEAYAAIKAQLSVQLLSTLREANDPRVTGDGETFERPPFTNPEAKAPATKKAKAKAN